MPPRSWRFRGLDQLGKGVDMVKSTCIDCGCQIVSEYHRKRCESCNDRHLIEYKKVYFKAHYKPIKKVPVIRVCAFCGVEFTALSCSRQKFCSRKCRIDDHTARTSKEAAARRRSECKVCPECGVEFIAKNTTKQKYCSSECGNRHNGPDSKTKTCSVAGCCRPVRARGVCGMHYKRLLRAEGKLRDPWDERRRKNYEKRRARKNSNGPVEDFTNLDIYERDKWHCGICGLKVDEDLAYPDPMSASLDHIVPLSKGGMHTRKNVQLAHLRCNVSKGDKILNQQRSPLGVAV